MKLNGTAEIALRRGLELQRSGGAYRDAQAWFRVAACAAPGDGRVAGFAIAGEPDHQLAICRRALCSDPASAAILERTGSIMTQAGDPETGESYFRRALLVEPASSVQAAFAVANRRMRRADAAGAYPLAWLAAQLAPGNPGVTILHATLAGASGRAGQAATAFAKAARLDPSNLSIVVSAAAAAWRDSRADATARLARQALMLSGAQPEAMALLADSLDRGADRNDAGVWPARVVVAAPGAAASWSCRAGAFIRSGDLKASVRDAARALMLDPAAQLAARHMVKAGSSLARFPAVRNVARRALLSHRGDPELSYYLAQAEKAVGDLGRGWDVEAARDTWPRFHEVRGLPKRIVGGSLPGDRPLVATEQGIGDELLFLSCLPDLLAECPSPIVEADVRLHPLLGRTFPGLHLIPRQARPHGGKVLFDYTAIVEALRPTGYLFAGDLPGRYRRDRERPSAQAGYLTVDPARRAQWLKRLDRIRGDAALTVGVSWSSISRSRSRMLYNSTLEAMLELFQVPGTRFVCLQYTDCREELAAFKAAHGIDIWRPDDLDQREDLDATAAMMSALDLVVSADTSACILAAATGVPTLRLGSGIYRILDDRDMFFANMIPMIGRLEPTNLPLAIGRAAAALRERVAGRSN